MKLKPVVAIRRCRDYEPGRLRAELRGALELLGGLERFAGHGESVLIKPNLIAPLPAGSRATTDPELIVAIAEIVLEAGGRPFVADSTAWGSVADCMKVLGIDKRLGELGVPFRNLSRPRWIRISPGDTRVGISSIALSADKVINLPKLKAHQQLGATIAVKNSFGCVSGKAKPLWHFIRGGSERRFCELLIGVHNAVAPTLNIIDGIIAMQGAGPMRGSPANIGAIVAGADAFACERVCADIIGMNEADVPILRTATELGLAVSSTNEVEIRGCRLSEIKFEGFEPAERIPIKFSFKRVCRSIARQAVMLVSPLVGTKNRLRP